MAREKKIVDASVVYKWFVHEEGSDEAIELLKKHRDGTVLLVVPELIFLEVLNALRYKRKTDEFLLKATQTLEKAQFHVEHLHQSLIEKAVHIALKNNLSIYDATYAALAQLYGTTLITADKALSKVPNAVML